MYPRDKITEQKVNIRLTNTSKLGGGDFNIFTMQFISRLQPNVDLSSVHSWFFSLKGQKSRNPWILCFEMFNSISDIGTMNIK